MEYFRCRYGIDIDILLPLPFVLAFDVARIFTLVPVNVVNIAMCLRDWHLSKLNIIISFYNILMHFG